jgi:hypothetical protein
VLFGDDVDFRLLDRSCGGWSEPADDVTYMAINYLFFSLQRSGDLAPPFEQLWDVIWNTYLAQSGDRELLGLVAPFFAWRARWWSPVLPGTAWLRQCSWRCSTSSTTCSPHRCSIRRR